MALPDPALPPADGTPPIAWHALTTDHVADQLGVDRASGLSDVEAADRLTRHGPNRLTEAPGKPAWKRFAEQLAQPLVLVLIAAGLVTSALGEWVDASVIFGVVLVNAVIGYWQEAKA
ncbi:MAG: cation-transporting P-type ATPase, partial [Azonexus sp.]